MESTISPGRTSSPIPGELPRARRLGASGIACTTATRPRAGRQPATQPLEVDDNPGVHWLPRVGRAGAGRRSALDRPDDHQRAGGVADQGLAGGAQQHPAPEPAVARPPTSLRPDSGNARGRSHTPAGRARPPARPRARTPRRTRWRSPRHSSRSRSTPTTTGPSAGGDASAVAPRITATGQSPCATSATAVEPTGGPEGELVVGVDRPQRMVPLGGSSTAPERGVQGGCRTVHPDDDRGAGRTVHRWAPSSAMWTTVTPRTASASTVATCRSAAFSSASVMVTEPPSTSTVQRPWPP